MTKLQSSNQMQLFSSIVKNISDSKKYQDLSLETLNRIVTSNAHKYKNAKDIEKNSRKDLHIIWDAFYLKRPDYSKLTVSIQSNDITESFVKDLLSYHSSTNERASIIKEFYKEIFKLLGNPSIIVDIGCGFNPLTIMFMPIKNCKYFAFDIDKAEVDFLNSVAPLIFKQQNINVEFKAEVRDILIDSFPETDVYFLLKIVPVIEQQKKGFVKEFVVRHPGKRLVISFPKESISGKKINMEKFYSNWFETNFKELKFQRLDFTNELVYILES